MIKSIVRDPIFLALKSTPATKEDKSVGQDLLDTLIFNRNGCVGMAANMIGVSKCILVFEDENKNYVLMYNPKILKKEIPYETSEGCLSLKGVRSTVRYKKIKVEYLDESFQKRIKTYLGFSAQIIQHEIDHMNGILI